MKRLLFLAVLMVSACGADGEPEPVGDTGISISGQARIGVAGTL